MADQSSIASILAALSQAQQAQQAQQRQAGGRPDPRAAPPPAPNPPGVYGYPAPSTSGAIDLSSLKPSSSGNMSFQDPRGAYPPAPSGVGQSPSYYETPRYGYDDRRGRSRRSRSPSRERSPHGYRYRERERSYSPDRRAGSPGRDTMVIDMAFVGLIIGRGGESLRRVEQDTGARIQFVPDESRTAKFRTCHIMGTSSQIRAARNTLQQMMNDHIALKQAQGKASSVGMTKIVPALGQSQVQIHVPDPTVGLVIGRGGETIRDLQDRSACHINIVSEQFSVNGLRPVNLIGTDESIRKARELIEEIVNSDTNGKPRAPINTDPSSNMQLTEIIKVPMDSVGMIIGKGGETVKDMQHNTQCKINVSSTYSPSDPTRDITLTGIADTIARAKAAIQEKIDLVNARKAALAAPPAQNYQSYAAKPAAAPATGGYDSQYYANYAAAAPATSAGPAAPSTGAAQADPYAAYGGYQNYVAMWQQWQQSQQPGQDGASAER